MNRKTLHAFSFACITLLPTSTSARCKDQHCQNLQDILYAVVIDFREFRSSKTPGPDVSIQGTKVPCQMTTWANNVPIYICYAQVPAANADSWSTAMLDSLRLLQPTWHFQITSPAADHYMDAGPPDCEIPPTGGPYLGQCPLRQANRWHCETLSLDEFPLLAISCQASSKPTTQSRIARRDHQRLRRFVSGSQESLRVPHDRLRRSPRRKIRGRRIRCRTQTRRSRELHRQPSCKASFQ